MNRRKYKAHYGVKPVRRAIQVDELLKIQHYCPSCNTFGISRVAVGIWKCKKCHYTVVGKAYTVEEDI